MQDKTIQGVVLVSVAVFAMAFGDALAKLLSENLSIWQIFLTRSIFGLPILVIVILWTGKGFKVHAPRWVLLRCGLIVLTWVFYYASFPFLSLSVAAVAIYTFPIMVALFSTILIGEPATKAQWTGILLGFVGVLVILKPGTDAFSWVAVLPIMGAACLALAMILTRSKCQKESPLVLSFYLLVSFLVVSFLVILELSIVPISPTTKAGYPFLLTGWAPMGAREWAIMAVIGVMAPAIFASIARAYQIAAPSIIATFDYVYLISATLWGLVFFAEKPGALTLAGMATIFFAGVLVALPARKQRNG